MSNESTATRIFAWLVALLVTCGCVGQDKAEGERPSPRYVLVDGGAHKGETIKHFEASDLYAKHPWQIFSFEPNPHLIPLLPQKPNVTVLNKALWIHDQGLEFYFGTTTLGGNVVKTQVTDENLRPIRVESVDFGRWLKDNFNKDDVIFVKLDIEGAEYPILNKMLKTGTIALIDKLYIEFHSFILKERTAAQDQQLTRAIEQQGIPVETHAPSAPQGDYFRGDR
jgi:FkbM family methyltransferase